MKTIILNILILFLLSFSLIGNAQDFEKIKNNDTIYLLFNIEKNEVSHIKNIDLKINQHQEINNYSTKWIKNKKNELIITLIKENTDSILFTILNYRKNNVVNQNKIKDYHIIKEEDLIQLDIVKFSTFFENKNIYIIEQKKGKFYVYKIDNYSYHERPQE